MKQLHDERGVDIADYARSFEREAADYARIVNHALAAPPPSARGTMKFLARATAKNGELFLYDDIGDSFFGGITPTMVAESLKELEGCTTLDLYINSNGGDVFAGYAIYSQLKRFPAKVTAHVDGIAASIASVICMCADTIVMAKFARMMIHDPAGGSWGSSDDLRKTADLMDAVKADIVTAYADRTKADPKDIAKWMSDETWMDAATSVERGFADKIDEGATMQAKETSPILAKYKNTPADLLGPASRGDVAIAKMEAYLLRNRKPPAA